jgi:oxygen-independent coproporphyrinogen-3 oxidase
MLPAGVYLHIPFCRSRCSYCDFAVSIYNGDWADKYVFALCKEIEKSKIKNPKIDTIYFGGGTPSLLTARQIEQILTAVNLRFEILSGAEVTLEINPATLTPETARLFRALGINRASFGAQTFDDRELKRLGRQHTADDARRTIEILRQAGFDNVSFDLIANLPNQSLADWRRNLIESLKLKPEHLSLYLLEIHAGTPLARHIREGKQPAPSEDLAGEMYELMIAETARAGYEHYEISNFCLRGFSSRHNSKYWTLGTVYGFGCSAHSFDGERLRWANERDALRYAKMIETIGNAVVEQTAVEIESEFIFLGLRLMQGICLDEYRRRFSADLIEKYAAKLERFFDAGLIEIAHNRLRLTSRGALFSNEVFAVFV